MYSSYMLNKYEMVPEQISTVNKGSTKYEECKITFASS